MALSQSKKDKLRKAVEKRKQANKKKVEPNRIKRLKKAKT